MPFEALSHYIGPSLPFPACPQPRYLNMFEEPSIFVHKNYVHEVIISILISLPLNVEWMYWSNHNSSGWNPGKEINA